MNLPDAGSQTTANAWRDALDRAAATAPAHGVAALYHEEREDLRAIWDPDRGEAAVEWSRSSGLAIDRDGGDLDFLADPSPSELPDALRGVPTRRSARSVQTPAPSDARPLIDWLGRFARAVERHSPGSRVEMTASGFEQRVTLARASSRSLEDLRRALRFRIRLRVGDRSRRAAAEVDVVVRGDRGPEDDGIELLARGLVERALARLDALPFPNGPSEVVFAPGAGGVLVHEIVGHALEADALREGSWLSSAVGHAVGPPGLTILDDPRRARAPWRIDDEGQAARVAPLLRDGHVVGALHDLETAHRDGGEPSGHGRRATFRDPIRPRMGCTFIAPGPLAPEEVVRPVVRGLYVRRIEAASVDVISGRAAFRVTDGDRIIDGRLDRPVAPCLLHVQAPQTLATITRVADDLAFDSTVGSCHRDGQTLAISVGAPTIWSGSGCTLY